MPQMRVGDVSLYYEVHGSGQPLLLIEGIGYASWMWFKQVPMLSRQFQVILFDNRGVGQSDMPAGAYTTAMMADDAAGLLEALGIEQAHVMGISMGGMIAQELVLRHPQKVDGLILGCTTPGGPVAPPPTAEYMAYLTESAKMATLEEKYRAGFELGAAAGYYQENPQDLEAMLGPRLANPQPAAAFFSQAAAVQSHNTWDRLGEIQAPTLIAHGDADRVVPVQNADLLAERITDSQKVIFPGAGHAFWVERAVAFNRTVMDFLQSL